MEASGTAPSPTLSTCSIYSLRLPGYCRHRCSSPRSESESAACSREGTVTTTSCPNGWSQYQGTSSGNHPTACRSCPAHSASRAAWYHLSPETPSPNQSWQTLWLTDLDDSTNHLLSYRPFLRGRTFSDPRISPWITSLVLLSLAQVIGLSIGVILALDLNCTPDFEQAMDTDGTGLSSFLLARP